MDEITRMTVVPDTRDIRDYRQGDIGQPLKAVGDDRWFLCCPMCGRMTTAYPIEMIERHEDGSVSTKRLLHCHRKDAYRQFRIGHNTVRWADE